MGAKFNLGQTVLDEISKIDGVIIKITFALGCEPEYCLARFGVDNDGRQWSDVWLYESRLV